MVQSIEDKRRKNAEYMRRYRNERKNDPDFMRLQRKNLRNFRKRNPGYQAKWAKNRPEYRDKNTELYRKRHPERAKAQRLAQHKTKLGQKCEKCESNLKLVRHHPDYDFPLQVITLCEVCHNKIHNPKIE